MAKQVNNDGSGLKVVGFNLDETTRNMLADILGWDKKRGNKVNNSRLAARLIREEWNRRLPIEKPYLAGQG